MNLRGETTGVTGHNSAHIREMGLVTPHSGASLGAAPVWGRDTVPDLRNPLSWWGEDTGPALRKPPTEAEAGNMHTDSGRK